MGAGTGFSQLSGGGSGGSLLSRVVYLEDNEYKVTYYSSVNSATGAVVKPTNSTIMLDQYPGGIDALVSKINVKPTGENPQTGLGAIVDVTSFDSLGNYTLSGTPSSFPVAIIYTIKIKAVDFQNINLENVLDWSTEDNSKDTGLSNFRSTAISTNINNADYEVKVTATGTTQTLPTAVGISGKSFSIKKSFAGGSVIVNTTSSQTIDGTLTRTLTGLANLTVMSDGANWIII